MKRIAWLSACLLAIGCRPSPTNDSALVTAWLTCIECTDGELDSLKALVARSPDMMDTLITAMVAGPSPALRDRIHGQLLATFPHGQAVTVDSIKYAEIYTGEAVATYHARAARAVAAIGGPRAHQALDSALALPQGTLSEYVRSTIQFARDSILGP